MLRALFVFLACALSGAWLPVAAADIVAFQRGVLIQGTIQPGDYAKLIAFVRHPDNYGRFARTENTGLFMTDGLARGAEIAHMVQADAGDDGAIGIEDIHRVQASTHAHFQYQDVDCAAQEQIHCG